MSIVIGTRILNENFGFSEPPPSPVDKRAAPASFEAQKLMIDESTHGSLEIVEGEPIIVCLSANTKGQWSLKSSPDEISSLGGKPYAIMEESHRPGLPNKQFFIWNTKDLPFGPEEEVKQTLRFERTEDGQARKLMQWSLTIKKNPDRKH